MKERRYSHKERKVRKCRGAIHRALRPKVEKQKIV
jgi:hypothetical protein